MKIIILGAPGAGKGTQAAFISEALNIPKISTGDMLRDSVTKGDKLGLAVKEIMEQGGYVSDDIIMELINARITQPDCGNGYLLDGFPRTQAQVEAMQRYKMKIDCVLEISVPQTEIINRLSGRRVHIASGRVYHIQHNPPKIAGLDDETKEPLVHRKDDKPETIKSRLDIYFQQTSCLINYYKERAKIGEIEYFKIDGNRDLGIIRADIESSLAKVMSKPNKSA